MISSGLREKQTLNVFLFSFRAEMILQVLHILFSDTVQCTRCRDADIFAFYFPNVDLLECCQPSVKSFTHSLSDNTFKSLLNLPEKKKKLGAPTGIRSNPGYHLCIYNTTAYSLLISKGENNDGILAFIAGYTPLGQIDTTDVYLL